MPRTRKSGNWIEKALKDDSYKIEPAIAQGDCYFDCVRKAMNDEYSVNDLRKIVQDKYTEEDYDLTYHNGEYTHRRALDTQILELEKISQNEPDYKDARKRIEEIRIELDDNSNDDSKKTKSKTKKTENKTKKQSTTKKYDFEAFKKTILKPQFWADNKAIVILEKELNYRTILFKIPESGEEFQGASLATTHGEALDLKIVRFMMVSYETERHYDLVIYKGKKLMTFDELPLDLRRMVMVQVSSEPSSSSASVSASSSSSSRDRDQVQGATEEEQQGYHDQDDQTRDEHSNQNIIRSDTEVDLRPQSPPSSLFFYIGDDLTRNADNILDFMKNHGFTDEQRLLNCKEEVNEVKNNKNFCSNEKELHRVLTNSEYLKKSITLFQKSSSSDKVTGMCRFTFDKDDSLAEEVVVTDSIYIDVICSLGGGFLSEVLGIFEQKLLVRTISLNPLRNKKLVSAYKKRGFEFHDQFPKCILQNSCFLKKEVKKISSSTSSYKIYVNQPLMAKNLEQKSIDNHLKRVLKLFATKKGFPANVEMQDEKMQEASKEENLMYFVCNSSKIAFRLFELDPAGSYLKFFHGIEVVEVAEFEPTRFNYFIKIFKEFELAITQLFELFETTDIYITDVKYDRKLYEFYKKLGFENVDCDSLTYESDYCRLIKIKYLYDYYIGKTWYAACQPDELYLTLNLQGKDRRFINIRENTVDQDLCRLSKHSTRETLDFNVRKNLNQNKFSVQFSSVPLDKDLNKELLDLLFRIFAYHENINFEFAFTEITTKEMKEATAETLRSMDLSPAFMEFVEPFLQSMGTRSNLHFEKEICGYEKRPSFRLQRASTTSSSSSSGTKKKRKLTLKQSFKVFTNLSVDLKDRLGFSFFSEDPVYSSDTHEYYVLQNTHTKVKEIVGRPLTFFVVVSKARDREKATKGGGRGRVGQNGGSGNNSKPVIRIVCFGLKNGNNIEVLDKSFQPKHQRGVSRMLKGFLRNLLCVKEPSSEEDGIEIRTRGSYTGDREQKAALKIFFGEDIGVPLSDYVL